MTGPVAVQLPLWSDPGFRRLVVWSVGGHVVLALILVISPPGRGSIPAPRAVMVELVAAPAVAPRPKRQVVDEPVVIPKRQKLAKVVPKQKPAPPKKPALTAEQIIAGLRKKVPDPAPIPEKATPAALAGGRPGFVDPLLAAYRSRVQTLLRQNWSGARAFSSQPELLVRFDVEIDVSGNVTAVAKSSSSGNPFYDESAERAIWRAEPLPAPPRGALTLDVNFRPGAVF